MTCCRRCSPSGSPSLRCLIPALKVLVGLVGTNLKTAFGVDLRRNPDRGESAAGRFLGSVARRAEDRRIRAERHDQRRTTSRSAKLPGVSKIDMVKFSDNIVTAADVGQDALDGLGNAAENAAGDTDSLKDAATNAKPPVVALGADAETTAGQLSEMAAKELDAKSQAELLRAKLADGLNAAIVETGEAAKTAADWIEEWRVKTLDAQQAQDLLTLSMGEARTGYVNTSDEVSALQQLVESMTERMTDVATEQRLYAQAQAALPPELCVPIT